MEIKFEAVCYTKNWRGTPRETYGLAQTDAAIYRASADGETVEVLAVCPNCNQWRHSGDCVHDCAQRGFAPKAGPETLNL